MEAKAVLLSVEDDLIVRMLAVEIAEEAGYSALQATGADEAIRSFRSALTSEWCSQTSTCPVPWTAWSSPSPSDPRWPRIQIV
jgi:CheY-like chemotaxis protein